MALKPIFSRKVFSKALFPFLLLAVLSLNSCRGTFLEGLGINTPYGGVQLKFAERKRAVMLQQQKTSKLNYDSFIGDRWQFGDKKHLSSRINLDLNLCALLNSDLGLASVCGHSQQYKDFYKFLEDNEGDLKKLSGPEEELPGPVAKRLLVKLSENCYENEIEQNETTVHISGRKIKYKTLNECRFDSIERKFRFVPFYYMLKGQLEGILTHRTSSGSRWLANGHNLLPYNMRLNESLSYFQVGLGFYKSDVPIHHLKESLMVADMVQKKLDNLEGSEKPHEGKKIIQTLFGKCKDKILDDLISVIYEKGEKFADSLMKDFLNGIDMDEKYKKNWGQIIKSSVKLIKESNKEEVKQKNEIGDDKKGNLCDELKKLDPSGTENEDSENIDEKSKKTEKIRKRLLRESFTKSIGKLEYWQLKEFLEKETPDWSKHQLACEMKNGVEIKEWANDILKAKRNEAIKMLKLHYRINEARYKNNIAYIRALDGKVDMEGETEAKKYSYKAVEIIEQSISSLNDQQNGQILKALKLYDGQMKDTLGYVLFRFAEDTSDVELGIEKLEEALEILTERGTPADFHLTDNHLQEGQATLKLMEFRNQYNDLISRAD